ncbi:energy transducer TonB [Archangium gephyra]|uniref:energy transducer TonB n=1 Tax=Archangium gephyra TaxID=48 RepID=UPI0035D522E0
MFRPRYSMWTRLLLLLLAHAALSACSAGRESAKPPATPRLSADVLQKALVLCQHQQLLLPVPSRLPEAINPSLYIREEDLDFIQKEPSLLPVSELDRPGLHAELARYVECEVTYAGLRGDLLGVWVEQRQPQWDARQLPPQVLQASSPEERRAALALWMQQSKPETISSRHLLRFRQSRLGWRADYQLPEEAQRFPSPRASRTPSRGPVPPPSAVPSQTAQQAPTAGMTDAASAGPIGGDVLPFGAGMTRPEKLEGPPPAYTVNALAARVQGLMVVKCVITQTGWVTRCRIIKPLPLLTDAVLMSLYQQRYTPVTFQGRPVQVDYTFNIRLTLAPNSKSFTQEQFDDPKTAQWELRDKARFLCRHHMLEAPVVSRLPQGLSPSNFIRQADLDFLQHHPSRVPPTDFDTPGFHADLAHYVRCEITDMSATKGMVLFSLEQQSPSAEDLRLHVPELLTAGSSAERFEALERWAQKTSTARGTVSRHQLKFVLTPTGWVADYQLPEKP